MMAREIANPPDPNPRRPKFALPKGACDTHIHLFNDKAKFPFAADATYESHPATAEMLIKLQETVGLSRAIVVSGGAYGRNYAVLEDALTRYPDRFRGVATCALMCGSTLPRFAVMKRMPRTPIFVSRANSSDVVFSGISATPRKRSG